MKNRIEKSKAVVPTKAKLVQPTAPPLGAFVPYTVMVPSHYAVLMKEIGETLTHFEDTWATFFTEQMAIDLDVDTGVDLAMGGYDFDSPEERGLAELAVRKACERFVSVEREIDASRSNLSIEIKSVDQLEREYRNSLQRAEKAKLPVFQVDLGEHQVEIDAYCLAVQISPSEYISRTLKNDYLRRRSFLSAESVNAAASSGRTK